MFSHFALARVQGAIESQSNASEPLIKQQKLNHVPSDSVSKVNVCADYEICLRFLMSFSPFSMYFCFQRRFTPF